MCPSPDAFVETQSPIRWYEEVENFGGWLCQEGGVLINEISALMKETPGYSPVIQW